MKEHNDMIDLFPQFGWEIKTGDKQIYGSPADIYAERKDDDTGEYFMRIDDGNVSPIDAIYHIYVRLNNLNEKIFEGRISTKEEFKIIMKTLSFEKNSDTTETKNFEELTEAEKALRSLIYAVETKDKHHPNHPFPMGEQYLNVTLADVKGIANKLGIPLVKADF